MKKESVLLRVTVNGPILLLSWVEKSSVLRSGMDGWLSTYLALKTGASVLVGSFVTISLRHNNLIKCHHSLLVFLHTLTKDLLVLHRNCSSSGEAMRHLRCRREPERSGNKYYRLLKRRRLWKLKSPWFTCNDGRESRRRVWVTEIP